MPSSDNISREDAKAAILFIALIAGCSRAPEWNDERPMAGCDAESQEIIDKYDLREVYAPSSSPTPSDRYVGWRPWATTAYRDVTDEQLPDGTYRLRYKNKSHGRIQ